MHAKNHRAIINQKQKHLIHTKAQAVHRWGSSFMNRKGGCISVKSEIMLLNSNITTIEAGERRRTDVTDHTVSCFCTLLPDKEKTMGAVFEVIKASEDKQSMKKLFTQNPKYKAMDNE